MKKFAFIIYITAFGILNACRSGSPESDQVIRIAAAANAQYALKALAKTFEKQHNLTIETIISSSGKLTAQIQQGAPYDIFISADMKRPRHLHKNKLCNAPKVYALGVPVLWRSTQLTKQNPLEDAGIQKLAIANPKHAPYGQAAVQWLKQEGLYDALQGRLVYGQSVSQVNHYILSGTVDAAITARSAQTQLLDRVSGHWQTIHGITLKQGAVMINKSSHKPGTQKFYTFLFSKEADSIWKAHGYKTLPSTPPS